MAWSEIIDELWSMKKHSSIFVISISHMRRRTKKISIDTFNINTRVHFAILPLYLFHHPFQVYT